MDAVEYHEAQKLVRDYVCSKCWGVLKIVPGLNRKFHVLCCTCDQDTVGYTTKHYVDEQKGNSQQDAKEVKQMLEDVGVLPKPEKKSTAQLLKELGF